MAEEYVYGIKGSVTLPSGFAMKTAAWNGVFEQVPVEVTSYADSGNRVFRGGLRGGSGTLVGSATYNASSTSPGWDDIAAGSHQTPAQAVLTAATGCTYTFDMLITSIEFGHNVQADVPVTMRWVASGAITQAWDESA